MKLEDSRVYKHLNKWKIIRKRSAPTTLTGYVNILKEVYSDVSFFDTISQHSVLIKSLGKK